MNTHGHEIDCVETQDCEEQRQALEDAIEFTLADHGVGYTEAWGVGHFDSQVCPDVEFIGPFVHEVTDAEEILKEHRVTQDGLTVTFRLTHLSESPLTGTNYKGEPYTMVGQYAHYSTEVTP